MDADSVVIFVPPPVLPPHAPPPRASTAHRQGGGSPMPRSSAPPVPARTHRTTTASPARRSVKSPARLPEVSREERGHGEREEGARGERFRGEVVPPVPARVPMLLSRQRSTVILRTPPPSAKPRLDSPRRQVAPFVAPRRSLTPPAGVHRSPLHAPEQRKHSVFIKPRGGSSPPNNQTSKDLKPSRTWQTSPAAQIRDGAGQIVSLTQWPIHPVVSAAGVSPPGLPPEGGTRPRRANEYVDGPSLGPAAPPPVGTTASPCDGLPEVFRPHGPGVNLRDCHDDATPRVRADAAPGGGGGLKAPRGGVSEKEKERLSQPPVCQEGIVCARCGRCRCDTCAQPRELPRRWLGAHECSAACAVDTLSCMCCVRAVLFHARCAEDEDWSEEPCACGGAGCAGRWALMAGVALTCLPCLACYWPLRCALGACTACYNSTHVIGCRCERGAASGGTKGLLTPESESSSY